MQPQSVSWKEPISAAVSGSTQIGMLRPPGPEKTDPCLNSRSVANSKHRVMTQLVMGAEGQDLSAGWEQYWKRPKRNKFQTQFKQNGGLVYIRNFLEKNDFSEVQKQCERLVGQCKPEKSSWATGRIGTYVPKGNPILEVLFSQSIANRLESLTAVKGLYPSDYPVELRVYRSGSAMEWHADDVLFAEPQMELVYTVENSAETRTQWRTRAGAIKEQWTEPNSLLIIEAGGAEHRVLPVKRGQRTILKMLFTTTNQKLSAYAETLGQY
mmetsp:Transcript_42457/g.66475  ORF Transcript_42457/g.66475 Transcript_42457/m.66475 type:complete len:268 (+) Transcript_42457:3-806(+)